MTYGGEEFLSDSSRLKNLSAIALAALIFSLLSSCSGVATEITSARDMKELLDEKGIDCDPFQTGMSDNTNAEVLSCEDGSANEENAYQFSIWSTEADFSVGLQEMCRNLDRMRKLEDEVVLGKTWFAFTDSSLIDEELLSSELVSTSIQASALCDERDYPIDLVLSGEAIAACEEIEEDFRKLPGLKFNTPSSEPFGEVTVTGRYETAEQMQLQISTTLRAVSNLKKAENLPDEFLALVQAFEEAADRDPLDQFLYPGRSTTHYGIGPDPFTWEQYLRIRLITGRENADHDQMYLDAIALAGEFNSGATLWAFPLANIVDTCDSWGAFDEPSP